LIINAELSKTWPVIARKKEPLPDAAEWDGKFHKINLLDRG
jgi:ferredoxin